MRSGLWPPVGFARGVICPALKYCNTELGTVSRSNVSNYLHKQVTVSSQRAKIVPVFSTHTERSWFTEPGHFPKRRWDLLSNFRQEEQS